MMATVRTITLFAAGLLTGHLAAAQSTAQPSIEELRVGPVEASRSGDLSQISPSEQHDKDPYLPPLATGTSKSAEIPQFQKTPMRDSRLSQLTKPDRDTGLVQEDASSTDRCNLPSAENDPVCINILEARAERMTEIREARIAAERERMAALFRSNNLAGQQNVERAQANAFDVERRIAFGDVSGSPVAQSIGSEFLSPAPAAPPPEPDPIQESLSVLPPINFPPIHQD